jgi:hypothetical protein
MPQTITLKSFLDFAQTADAKLMPMVGAHIARNTSPPTQYLGKGRGYSPYYPMIF